MRDPAITLISSLLFIVTGVILIFLIGYLGLISIGSGIIGIYSIYYRDLEWTFSFKPEFKKGDIIYCTEGYIHRLIIDSNGYLVSKWNGKRPQHLDIYKLNGKDYERKKYKEPKGFIATDNQPFESYRGIPEVKLCRERTFKEKVNHFLDSYRLKG